MPRTAEESRAATGLVVHLHDAPADPEVHERYRAWWKGVLRRRLAELILRGEQPIQLSRD
jgi:hypothetical protein